MENNNNDDNKKVVTASNDAAADAKAKQAPVTADEKPTNKRDHEAMSASSSAVVVAAPAPVNAAAPAPAPAPPVAEVAANERPSLPRFPCRMHCPHIFTSERALCGHMCKHPGRNWKGTNPPAEASSSAHGAGNGDDEAGGTGGRKKVKKGLPFDLNELPPPEEDDDDVEKKNN